MSGRYSYRRYYRRRYPYSTRRRAYSFGSRSKRRALGNYRAARQQRDASQVNLSIPLQCTAASTVINVQGHDPFHSGTYAINIWDLLRKSSFYQSYANMYDQVKIDRIRIKITPTEWTFNAGDNAVKAITLISAWDRTGLSQEQLEVIVDDLGDDKTVGNIADNNYDGLYVKLSGSELSTYSSAITKNLNPGTSISMTRTLYPSTIQEKAQFVNTADLKAWYGAYDANKHRYVGWTLPEQVVRRAQGQAEVEPLEVLDSFAQSHNPCYLQEDVSIPFKPTLLLGCLGGVTDLDHLNDDDTYVLKSVAPVLFNVEADIGVTFRGLRKAPIVE